MKKTLIHISHQVEYKALTHAIQNNNNAGQTINAMVHNNLMDIVYHTNPESVILPAFEYTQEFHDFITEYHTRKNIFLFVNTVVDDNLLDVWNSFGIHIIASLSIFTTKQPVNFISYDNLYDDSVYVYKNKQRNDKIAVYLSQHNDKNHQVLDDILYPKTIRKLVLFNSASFKHPQNVGFITPENSCDIMNTFDCIVDIDDRYRIESTACNIDSIAIEGSLEDNINNRKIKPRIEDISNLSYNQFSINNILPKLN